MSANQFVKCFASVAFCLVISQTTHAALLIEKVSGGGFVAPEMGNSERCRVTNEKVVVSRTYGSGASKTVFSYETPVNFTGIEANLQLALGEKVFEKPNQMCDAPSTTVRAFIGKTAFSLFETGGCGSARKERVGIYSARLMDIVNAFCPKTYDFSTPEN